jgi:aspartate racemase
MKKLGLFGTRFTMQAQFYPEVFSRQGITILLPDLADQVYIHDKYMNELVNGLYLDETRERLLVIIDRMIKKFGIQGLILGGTELPFILRNPSDKKFQYLDTTKIHVERVVAEILSG